MMIWGILITYRLMLIGELIDQTDLADSISLFHAECLEEVTDAKSLVDFFELTEYRTGKATTMLKFIIVANCAQVNKGFVSTSADTLIIEGTDTKFVEIKTETVIDSAGHEVTVSSEVYETGSAFCDCKIRYEYQFSKSISGIRYLRYHDRVFEINKLKD